MKAAITGPMAVNCISMALLAAMTLGCREDTPPQTYKKTAPAVAQTSPSQPSNILVITMDTTRADHLRCYGHQGIQTPNIDALAGEGVLFEEAFSVQPVTLPSHCSIFTGTYPFRHGVRDNNIYQLSSENETLAELLSRRGYLTTAFVASYILNHRFGLDQGFRYYNDRFVKPKQKGRLPVDRRAREVSFLATEWLREVTPELETRPFFLWLHYYDPHADYSPPHPWNTAYGDPYDGEIAYMDDWLGYFFDELKKAGKWDNTMIVLVGDHGEGLGEHDENTHGMFIYRSTTHVPLIIRFPYGQYGGKRVASRVSQVDIVPTVLNVLGAAPPADIDGKNLMPLVTGAASENRDVYSETYIPRSFNWSELSGLRSGERFFIDAPLPEFYQLNTDVDEQNNLYTADLPEAQTLQARLEKMRNTAHAVSAGEVVLNDEMTQRLEELGYFIASERPELSTGADLPDPKQRIKAFNTQQKANNLFDGGYPDDALRLYEALVADDPNNPRLLMDLGRVLKQKEMYRKAEKIFLKASALDSQNGRIYSMLGTLYKDWGRTALAVSAFEKAIAINEKDTISLFHLSLIAMAEASFDDAETYLNRIVDIQPTPAAYNNLGYIAIKGRHRFADGIRYLKNAVKVATDKPPFIHSLGVAYLDAGKIDQALPVLKQVAQLVPDNQAYIATYIRALDAAGDDAGAREMENRLQVLRKRLDVNVPE